MSNFDLELGLDALKDRVTALENNTNVEEAKDVLRQAQKALHDICLIKDRVYASERRIEELHTNINEFSERIDDKPRINFRIDRAAKITDSMVAETNHLSKMVDHL
jgi:DNA repair ATPase RecN